VLAVRVFRNRQTNTLRYDLKIGSMYNLSCILSYYNGELQAKVDKMNVNSKKNDGKELIEWQAFIFICNK